MKKYIYILSFFSLIVFTSVVLFIPLSVFPLKVKTSISLDVTCKNLNNRPASECDSVKIYLLHGDSLLLRTFVRDGKCKLTHYLSRGEKYCVKLVDDANSESITQCFLAKNPTINGVFYLNSTEYSLLH